MTISDNGDTKTYHNGAGQAHEALGVVVVNGDTMTYHDSAGQPREALGVVVLAGGEGGGESVEWDDVQNKPATFPPVVGTTSDTAKPGDYSPAWSEVTNKPAVMGVGATQQEAREAIGALPDDYAAPVTSVAGKTGAVTLNAADVGARPSSYVPAWSEVTDKPDFATLYSPRPRGNMSHPIPAVYAVPAANQTLQTGTNTNIVFSNPSFDQFSMLTEDGFVVPSWASHARVTLGLVFETNGTGARYASVTRNSTTLNPVRVVAVSGATTIAILTTPIRAMASGSILNAVGWQNSGGDLDVTTASWIQVELFETI